MLTHEVVERLESARDSGLLGYYGACVCCVAQRFEAAEGGLAGVDGGSS
jgi:hypothetical protein